MSELRYAQEQVGQQLHLVEAYGSSVVSFKALCGREPTRRGNWRMTINAPLGHACKRCWAAYLRRRKAEGEG